MNRAERRLFKKRKGEMMLLNVFERLLLRNIVPQIQGWNYAHMKEARELIEGLFTEQEEVDLQFEQEGTQVKWKITKSNNCPKHDMSIWAPEWLERLKDNPKYLPDVICTCVPIPQERDIPVSDGLKTKVGKFLKQLDKEEKLEMQHFSLCEKFGMDEKLPN